MAGSSGGTTLNYPTPPPQPSTADAIKQYVESLPQLYAAQLQYAPQEAAQQVQLAQQYAQPLAQAYQSAQDVLYPGTSGLQEQLASQATQGINAQVPDWMKDQYHSDLNAQLGTNVNSGAGADYVSRGLLQQQQQYQQYYQNLGLSLAGRQPLVNPTTPNYTNQLANYQPGQGLNYTSGNYGTFAAAGRPVATQQGTPNWIPGLQAVGSVLQGVGSFAGCWVASEIFGGWYHPKTIWARMYIANSLFKNLYLKYGERISLIIKNNLILKLMLRPLFEYFAMKGRELKYG